MDDAAKRQTGSLRNARGDLDGTRHEVAAVSEAAMRMLALIGDLQTPFETKPCPDCGADLHYRWGSLPESGTRRWRCRGCDRTFTAKTGTLLAGLHAPEKLRDVVIEMFSATPRSCRKLGAALGLDKTTIWSWRCKINALLVAQGHAVLSKGTPSSTEIVRESRKASREWVNHRRDPDGFPEPERLRWVDYAQRRLPLPEPMTPYLIAVLLGTCGASLLPAAAAGAKADEGAELGRRRRAGAEGECQPKSRSTADHPAAQRGARSPMTSTVSCYGDGELSAPPDANIAVGAICVAFRRFISTFRGPSSRYLDGYVAWFVARRRVSIS